MQQARPLTRTSLQKHGIETKLISRGKLEVREHDGKVTGTQQPANNNKTSAAGKKSDSITNADMTEADAKK